MSFSESFLEELAARNSIEDVVGSYVQLNKRSGSNLFGLCPFHSEKTPSFSVNTERQIYHCFGCGKGGTVINFVMEEENLSFPDAVQFLARRVGMEVPEQTHDPSQSFRTRLLELNKEAARFFYSELTKPSGSIAQQYLASRQISPDIAKRFGLGFAPNSWNSLIDALAAKGYSRAEIIQSGLAKVGKNGNPYDYFRNRLMFPIIDVRGSIIGFSGRILDDSLPKYLNSPDTLVYSKSKSLFGLNLAKKSKAGYMILVEGNVDVVSLHQAGFDSAIASLGTSFTPDQARLISRYTNNVIISYDADSAGQKAAQKAISILQPLDLKVKVLRIPGSKDPDEFIKNNGPEAFRNLIERSGNQIEYNLSLIKEKYDLEDPAGKVNYLKEAVNYIAALPNSIEREVYSERACEFAGVSSAAFLNEVERNRKKLKSAAKKQQTKEVMSIRRNFQPEQKEFHYDNLRSAKAEQGLINLLYRFPELFTSCPVDGSMFSSSVLGRFFDEILNREKNNGNITLAVMGEIFSADELSLLAGIIQNDSIAPHEATSAIKDFIAIIKDENNKSKGVKDLNAFADYLKKTKAYGGK